MEAFGPSTGVSGFQEQRFPESCQRTSLRDEDDSSVDFFDDSMEYGDNENGDDDIESLQPESPRNCLSPLTLPSTSPPPACPLAVRKNHPTRHLSADSHEINSHRRSNSWDTPALTSDSDSASSVEPPSPHLRPFWGGSSDSRLRLPVRNRHTTLPPSAIGRYNDEDSEDHTSFSKIVVTKFNNPPRYKLKKVKFHQCPVCEKSFPRPSGLKTHMNTHTNNKPHTCPYEGCDKSFSVISNAKRHYRTHAVDLPPEQTLPSGPYNVDFSNPVVVSSGPSPLSTPPASSSFESSFSHSSESSSGPKPSPALDSSGRHRRGFRGATLRWLPPGTGARAPRKGWEAPRPTFSR